MRITTAAATMRIPAAISIMSEFSLAPLPQGSHSSLVRNAPGGRRASPAPLTLDRRHGSTRGVDEHAHVGLQRAELEALLVARPRRLGPVGMHAGDEPF